MDTIYKAGRTRDELITKIDSLAKLYQAANRPAEKRAIYARLFALRVELSRFSEEENVDALQFLGTNYKNNTTFLN